MISLNLWDLWIFIKLNSLYLFSNNLSLRILYFISISYNWMSASIFLCLLLNCDCISLLIIYNFYLFLNLSFLYLITIFNSLNQLLFLVHINIIITASNINNLSLWFDNISMLILNNSFFNYLSITILFNYICLFF